MIIDVASVQKFIREQWDDPTPPPLVLAGRLEDAGYPHLARILYSLEDESWFKRMGTDTVAPSVVYRGMRRAYENTKARAFAQASRVSKRRGFT